MGNDKHAPAGRDDAVDRVEHAAAAEAADQANAPLEFPLYLDSFLFISIIYLLQYK